MTNKRGAHTGFSLVETCVSLFVFALSCVVFSKVAHHFDIKKVLDAFQKLTFLPPAMMVVAYNLRVKIVELSGKSGLSESEQKRLNRLIHKNVKYLVFATVFYVFLALVLALSPIVGDMLRRSDLYAIAVGALVVVALYFLVAILTAFGEVERFKFQIEERAREAQERERLLNKMK